MNKDQLFNAAVSLSNAEFALGKKRDKDKEVTMEEVQDYSSVPVTTPTAISKVIAEIILESGIVMEPWHREKLERVADESEEDDEMSSVDFRKRREDGDLDCTLYCRYDRFSGYTRWTNPETGDEYRVLKFDCQINWSSYGSMSTTLAEERLQHMLRVTNLAKSIEIALRLRHLVDRDGQFLCLWMTKAEKEKYESEARRAAQQRILDAALLAARKNELKGMLVGHVQYLKLPAGLELPMLTTMESGPTLAPRVYEVKAVISGETMLVKRIK
jgi:hypothetical protein